MSCSAENFGLFFADDRNDDFEADLGVQQYGNLVIANILERTAVEMDLGFDELESGLLHGLADIAGTDGTEEFALFAHLAHDLQGNAGHTLGARLGFAEHIGLRHLKLGALRLELGTVLVVGGYRLAIGNKIVAGKTGLDLDLFAEGPEITHLFK